MPRVFGVLSLFLVIGLATACRRGDDSNMLRGRGLKSAQLSPLDEAGVYHAALRATFDTDDPALSLLLDPRFLPRTPGVGLGTPMPADLASTLRGRGIVKGTCQAPT